MSRNAATSPEDVAGEKVAKCDAVIVGAGFAGLYAVYRLRQMGFEVRCFEAGSGVGGTWFWNRYPGARCDVESVEYSYSFSDELQQEWEWTERYPAQAEILRYIDHVADRFNLRPQIQLNTRVTGASFDERAGRWQVRTDKGDVVSARFCIMATGCLSAPKVPAFKGLSTFKGAWYHTGNWPHEKVDFSGKRVGVIGTGSTGIQAIPVIAEDAAQVYVFQRTAAFSLPARNAPQTPERARNFKTNYRNIRHEARYSTNGYALLGAVPEKAAHEVTPEERDREFQRRWEIGGPTFMRAYNDLVMNKSSNDSAADFVHDKIRQTVKNPDVAEKLIPTGYAIGTKRLPIDTNYFETYNRDNVTLVDVRTAPIEEITLSGLRTNEADYELDCIVFATGYDAMTGALLNIDIRGQQGRRLSEKWAAGPRAYLGLMTAGFPNLFMITGPGSPSVLGNVITSIEQHVDWLAECIAYMNKHGYANVDADLQAEDSWVAHVNEVADTTLYPQSNSWYMGANIPGKPRVFMPYIGGVGVYRKKCEEIVVNNYEGFVMSGAIEKGVAAQ